MKPQIGELVFFWILFGVVGLLTFTIMSPYLTPLFLAGVFAILFSPIHKRVQEYLKRKDGLAALITVLIVFCAVLIPLIFLGVLMFQEVLSIYGKLMSGTGAFTTIDGLIEIVENFVQSIIPTFEIQSDVYTYLESLLAWAVSHLNSFFTGIVEVAFQIFLIIIGMFFLYRDGERLRAFALKWSPLNDKYDESIIAKVGVAVSSVVKGSLTTAIVQGALVGVGFFVFGIPNPVLWAVVATIAALIPLFGTSIITMPAAVWLLLTGHLFAGVGLLIWSVGLVGLMDNMLRPILMKRGMDVHPFLILLSVFGGLVYFGPVGFLAGPIVLAFFFALLEIYPQVVTGRAITDIPPKE